MPLPEFAEVTISNVHGEVAATAALV